jgi:hypothetical protein
MTMYACMRRHCEVGESVLRRRKHVIAMAALLSLVTILKL